MAKIHYIELGSDDNFKWIRDILKDNGIECKLTYSIYVGHKCLAVNSLKLREAKDILKDYVSKDSFYMWIFNTALRDIRERKLKINSDGSWSYKDGSNG